jgi:hypothetical protein
LRYFAQQADQVDFYVIFWDSPNIAADQIQKDFQGYNLKYIRLEPETPNHYHPFDGPAYLSNIANQEIFKEEFLNGKYDAIVDTRPDVGFDMEFDPDLKPSPPMTVCTTRYEPVPVDNGGSTVNLWEGLEDHFFMMDSTTYTIWNQRTCLHNNFRGGQIKWVSGNHSMLKYYAEFHNISVYVNPKLKCEISRPPIAILQNLNFIHSVYKSRELWNGYSIEQKDQIMEITKIPKREYEYAFGVYHPPENN